MKSACMLPVLNAVASGRIMSKQKPIEEILAGWDGFDRPADGARYQHYKGGQYEIVATGFIEDSETPCVAYRSLRKKHRVGTNG